jgi:hypothetical protein
MIATICRVVWAPRLVVFVADVVFGAFSLAVARGEAGYSFGGSSTFASAAEMIAGCALLAVGLIAPARPREARLGTILVAAPIAWFVLEWNNPGASSAPVFAAGLVLYNAAPPPVRWSSAAVTLVILIIGLFFA